MLVTVTGFSQEVKFKVTNTDPVTGKRVIAFLQDVRFGADGYPTEVRYIVTLKEVNETTDAIPLDNTERAKRAVESYEEVFYIAANPNFNQRKIHNTTLLYLPDNTVDPNAITLQEYFRTKAINTFPGVANADPLRDVAEGILRQVILIKQANGQMPQ